MLQEGQVGNGGALDSSTVSLNTGDAIILKVQTSKKNVVYSIAKVNFTQNIVHKLYLIVACSPKTTIIP